MVTQETKGGGDEGGVRPSSCAGEEPPPPPQPPYHLSSHEVGVVRLDRERRSIRKLTKDSGYETSQYAESDYANVDWEQSSDRSPTSKSTRSPSSDWGAASDHDFPTTPPPGYLDRYNRVPDGWRNQHWSNSSKSSHHPQPPWNRHHHSDHRKSTSSSSSHGRRGSSAAAEPLGRYSSTDSLASASSSSLSFPPASVPVVSSAKSTPSLVLNPRDEDASPRRPVRPRAASAAHMSSSTPNLEQEEPFRIRHQASSLYCRPTGRWDDCESSRTYHCRQVSSGSERTSSSSQHSRQLSSQSSFSEEDFRIQSIKEEFEQRNHDYYPPPPPPYPSKYYSGRDDCGAEGKGGGGSSPPPPPPVRDASSLKYGMRHHEKFPSWPVGVSDHGDDGQQIIPPTRGSKYTDQHKSYQQVSQVSGFRYERFYYNISKYASSETLVENTKKDRPPAYEDGPPPPYSPYWNGAEAATNVVANANTKGDTATPLMDRLCQESQVTNIGSWKEENSAYNGRDSVTSSTSSQETLKWHGSTSDLSVQSERARPCIAAYAGVEAVTVHSARVQPPQRHHSESVLYYGKEPPPPSEHNWPSSRVVKEHSAAIPNSSWAEQVRKNNVLNTAKRSHLSHAHALVSPRQEALAREEIRTLPTPEFAKPLTSVAQRVQDLERLQARNCNVGNSNHKKAVRAMVPQSSTCWRKGEDDDRALYLDPEKRHRVSDPELKAIQKQAVLSFFERQTAAVHGSCSLSTRRSSAIMSHSLPRYQSGEDGKGPVCIRQSRSSSTAETNPRVAIYYNTYTQTLLSGDEPHLVREHRPVHHGATAASPPTLSLREWHIGGNAEVNSRPRMDVALQTEPFEGHVRQRSLKSSSASVSEGCVRPSVSSSCSEGPPTPDWAKKPRPPERPPKRPHLKQAPPNTEPPPPLLPRAPPTSVVAARVIVDVPATPASTVTTDEDPEDQELLSIEESARQLRDLEPPGPAAAMARPPPPCLEEPSCLSRGSTPELPPPPPPPQQRTEDSHEDDPLPPPPTPTEVTRILLSGNTSPISYPKDSYMSFRSERQPGRQGYDGNYHRRSLGPSPETVLNANNNGDPETSSLTPTAWEKWHNIGRPGATVVFTSSSLKPSGASKHPSSKSDDTTTTTTAKCFSSYNDLTSVSDTSQLVSSHRTQSDAAYHRGYSLTDKKYSKDNYISDNRSQELQSRWRSSTDTLNVNCQTSFYGNGDCIPSAIRNSPPSSPESGTRSSPLTRSQRTTSSGTQTAVNADLLKQTEVTTQTTPSVAKYGRTRRQEEVECEILSKDLARQLPEEDKVLQALLIPRQLKTTADYMQGLFEATPPSRHLTRPRTDSASSSPSPSSSSSEIPKRSPEAAVLPADSAYFTTSESKAKFLTRYSKDMSQAKAMDLKDSAELGKKKEDLVESIDRKLEVLRSEQLAMQEEIDANQELGAAVTVRVEKLAKPNELDKYRLHVEEIDKITNLLLGLSGRLARAENALMGLPADTCKEEREILKAKRDKLFDQHEEAKRLKENIDRRSVQVSNFLHNYLSSEEYADYDHFIKMKSKLLIDSKEIDDRIKLGEEQTLALKDSLGLHS